MLKGRRLTQSLAAIDESAREYDAICGAIAVLGHLTPRVRDAVVARGERLSAQLLAAALESEGGAVAYLDPVAIVRTDDRHGSATPLIDATGRRLRAFLRDAGSAAPHRLVIPGFIGAAPDGSVTTMGRGGSDLTATLVGRCLRARRVVLWKDVPGILTADPRMVPDARVIPELHRREAAEVAHFGAKVLHPRALIPLTGTSIPVEVRSFINPDARGTEVTARRSMKGYPVKAIALLADQAVITVAGKGMAGVHGIAARAFAAVDAEQLSVSTIFQASSESSIGFTLPAADAERAVARLRRAFSVEIAQGLIDGVSARAPVAVIAVVGEGMVGTPGISARVFSALAAGGINVVAIAQGLVRAQHFLRRVFGGRARRHAARARCLSTVEDRRRQRQGRGVHGRGAAWLWPGRPRPGGSNRRPLRQGIDSHRRSARSIRVRVRRRRSVPFAIAAARQGEGSRARC